MIDRRVVGDGPTVTLASWMVDRPIVCQAFTEAGHILATALMRRISRPAEPPIQHLAIPVRPQQSDIPT